MKQTIIILTVLLFSILSCQKKECTCNFDPKVVIENDSILNVILNDVINEEVAGKSKWLNYFWGRYDEPVLHLQKNESYRFLINDLLDYYVKIYRVEKIGKRYKSEIKVFAKGMAKNGGDSLMNHISKEISKLEWQEITDVFEKKCFWTMPIDIESDDGYLDGSLWSLEGFKKYNNCTSSNFHGVGRHSPDSSAYTIICEKMMKLDPLEIQNFSSMDDLENE